MRIVNYFILMVLLHSSIPAQQIVGISVGHTFQNDRSVSIGADYFAEIDYFAFKARIGVEPYPTFGAKRGIIGITCITGLTSDIKKLFSIHVMAGYNNQVLSMDKSISSQSPFNQPASKSGMVTNAGIFYNPHKSRKLLIGIDIYAWPQISPGSPNSEAVLSVTASVNYRLKLRHKPKPDKQSTL